MSEPEIEIQRAEDCPPAAAAFDDAELAGWARHALQQDGGALVLRLVGEDEGRALNQAFRDRDAATNVLSFPAEPLPEGWPAELAGPSLGDIVLCVPVLEREAREQGKSLREHCAHLVVHGVLHLRGHDHQNAAEAAAMEALETALLAELGIDNPYQVPPGETLDRHG